MINCSSCTPEMFSKKTQEDIFELFESLQEMETKIVNCEGCGLVEISKVEGKLKIKKIE